MRTPKRLMNGLSIMIFRLREQGMTLMDVAFHAKLNDHSEVCYHIKRYNDMISVNPKFKRDEKDFRMDDFKEQYKIFRESKSKNQRERQTVSVINTNTGQKQK